MKIPKTDIINGIAQTQQFKRSQVAFTRPRELRAKAEKSNYEGGGQTLQKYLKKRLELIELNATHQIVTARSSTSATKDGAKEPLEFFPVDAVDDEVH